MYNLYCNSKPLSLLEQKQVRAGWDAISGGEFGFHTSFVEEAKVAILSRAVCVLEMTFEVQL